MSKKKKHPEHEEHVNHERWMVSYADMLTLLLALFVVMFAISKVDQKKFATFAEGAAAAFCQANVALQGKQGSLDGSDGILDGTKATQEEPQTAAEALARELAAKKAAAAEQQQLAAVRDKIQRELAAKGLKNAVEFQLDERGLVVNIVTDKVLFDTGQADLRSEGAKMLNIIAPSVKSLPNKVTVEGHTDNVPMTGKFTSNWELSTARATTVVRALIADGLPARRVSAAGYADQRPISSNNTASGRARNRRVAIVVLPTVSAPAAATTTTSAASTTAGAGATSSEATGGSSSSSSNSSSSSSTTTTHSAETPEASAAAAAGVPLTDSFVLVPTFSGDVQPPSVTAYPSWPSTGV
jgi:chemotaxis protein MotB